MSKIENAVSMFGEGFVCSQALLATYGTQFGLDREIALKAAAPLSGAIRALTIKKIPKAVLRKCEWGHDDYSLEIKNLPKAPPEPDEQTEDTPAKSRRKFGKGNPAQATLFDFMEGGPGDE